MGIYIGIYHIEYVIRNLLYKIYSKNVGVWLMVWVSGAGLARQWLKVVD